MLCYALSEVEEDSEVFDEVCYIESLSEWSSKGARKALENLLSPYRVEVIEEVKTLKNKIYGGIENEY